MSYRLVDANDLAFKYPEVNDMPCVYADLPNGLNGAHYNFPAEDSDLISRKAVVEWLKYCTDDSIEHAIDSNLEFLPSVQPIRPKTDAIPVEWLKEKLVNHPELSYSLTDGIINVLDFWKSEMESDS